MAELLQQQTLEGEIAQMEKALADKKRALIEQGALTPEQIPHPKEMIKEVLKEKSGEPGVAPGQQQPASPPPAQKNDPHSPSYLRPELKELVQEYINLAFSTSIFDAVKKVRETNNAALIDAVHDAITDELWKLLQERGKLENL